MTSKERVRAALSHQKPDRIPAAFEAVESVRQKLLLHYGFRDMDQLLEKFQIDILPADPRYTSWCVRPFGATSVPGRKPLWTPIGPPPTSR